MTIAPDARDNLFDLTGKVAVITGSSRGIGRAIALRMAQHGAKVVVTSRKAEACEKVAEEIRASGGEAIVVPCNVSDKAQLQALVDATVRHWGRIDILVCNAAVNPFFGPSKDIPDDAFDKIMDVNIKSNHWLCNMAAPDMAKRQDGAIIIISSVGGCSVPTRWAPMAFPRRPTCSLPATWPWNGVRTTSAPTASHPA